MKKTEVEKIIKQINNLYDDNWAGIQVNQIFDEIDDKAANRKLSLFNNTIHQIAQHILATELVVIKRLQGINYKLTEEEDWVPVDKLKSVKWSDTIKAINESKKELINQVSKKVDSDLNNPIIENHSTIYETIHGHIQHSYYHIGQISIIKKLIEDFNE